VLTNKIMQEKQDVRLHIMIGSRMVPLHGQHCLQGQILKSGTARTPHRHACSRKDMMVADSVIVRPSISITGSSPDGTWATNSAGLDLPISNQH